MSYLKDREVWLEKTPTGNPPAGYYWKFIQDGVVVVRDSDGVDKKMVDESNKGKVLQVVSATTSTQVTVASTTWTDSTLTATITPKSTTSKVVVLISQYVYISRNGGTSGGVRLLRGSTVIWNPSTDIDGSGPRLLQLFVAGLGTAELVLAVPISMNYTDSPETIEPITYKTQGRPTITSSGSQLTFQKSENLKNGESSIILMEIEA